MSRYLPAAIEIARAAGDLLMDHFGRTTATGKGGLDLVTEADLASEALIVTELRDRYPEHGVVAEESAPDAAGAGSPKERTWYVDPLDGTGNFSRSDPHFAVALGLVHDGLPVLGVVYNPARDQLFTAAPAEPDGEARCNGSTIQPAICAHSMETASLATDWPWDLALRQRTLTLLEMTASRVRQTKIRGCATLDLCDVALGRLDAYLHPGCMPWDLAAPIAVNRAVGQAILTCDRWWEVEPQPVVVAAPELLPKLRELTQIVVGKKLLRDWQGSGSL